LRLATEDPWLEWLDYVFPAGGVLGAGTYDQPVYPFNIYNPAKYAGPQLQNVGYDQIVSGYGKPTATMYPLERGTPDIALPAEETVDETETEFDRDAYE